MFRRVKIAKTDIAIDTKNHLPNEDNGPHGNAAANPPSPHEAGFLRRDVPLALISIGLFSCLINILALTGPLFMVQIYDRVLPSRALPTLIALLVLAVGLYAIFGVLDVVRTRLMARVAGLVDTSLSGRVFAAIIRAPLHAKAGGDALRPAHELDLIRSALTGPGPIAIFDLPWIPIYLAICFLLHPLIGWLTAAAMALFVTIAFLTDTKTRSLTRDAATAAAQRNHCAQSAYRGSEAIAAMGMGHALKAHWDAAHEAHVTHQHGASDVGNTLGGTSKAIRYVLQSAALGAGAYLAVTEQISAGLVFAASIIVARAVAPIEQIIGHWKTMLAAWQAWQRLKDTLASIPEDISKTTLPPPSKNFSVESVFAVPPGEQRSSIRNVTFKLTAGTVLGILGSSGSGKSSLVRALVGVWPTKSGSIRLDGASLDQWSAAALGRHIGYLPQSVDLFPGSIAANIARMDPYAPDAAIIEAAKAGGLHDMITALPGGYDLTLRDGGSNLSAGQRQRIGLARALYGDPFLVVLDEPNSNLDTAGEEALAAAIAGVRARGGIAIVVAHRKALIPLFDQVLIMEGGLARAFGPTAAVFKALEKHASKPSRGAHAPTLTVVEGEGA